MPISKHSSATMANVPHMHEFSSISVSAFEADSLAARLTEQAADGWDVVSIVSADSKVIAFLSREATAPAEAPPESVTGDEAAPAFVAAATTPVEEPAGWASEPEPTPVVAQAAVASAVVDPILPESAPVAEPAAAAVVEPIAATEPVAEQPAQQAAAAAAVAPAGWYADPSGRYELRYWDGSQWTEHVSRAGQQFTDPPVA
jgi:Protein of unknown function (DUF2510)